LRHCDAGRDEALNNIAKAKRDKDDHDIILFASQIAIVADARLEPSEEAFSKIAARRSALIQHLFSANLIRSAD
jgi:tRNA A37 threonylcarbamoyladenosine synthetase subunit TsaC/SUA5/YrdC